MYYAVEDEESYSAPVNIDKLRKDDRITEKKFVLPQRLSERESADKQNSKS